ncbi:hypothetical protein JCGZ_22851 [Jatropha curcas]|uniref:Neprosin PEP catalytic domain-containing protein n=1 Tax=Jatropha curcas TaxID=180498 RepID=A0A067JPQ2_JATCU|nr:hypothetical protein JCGZ_22851 [Jatropha curcas]
MAFKVALAILFLWYLSPTCIGRTLSVEEDLELEKELKRLTKPAVETILTIYGDTYDCVDFYKQPAFDHPLLKNHSYHFQMKPTSYPTGRRQRNSSSILRPETIWLNGKGCPTGTVPIKRVTKDDLIRAKLAAEIYASNVNPQNAARPGVHFAGGRLSNGKYYGAGMFTSLYNPKLYDKSQYSSSEIKIQNGPDSLIFGWTVNPAVYRDTRTRLFIYTNAGNSHCFNTHCSGFILNRADIPLDFAFPQLSEIGGPTYTEHFFAYKDAANGDWIFQIGWQSEYSTQVGWWPKKIFTGLADSATYIEWGGEVYSPPNIPSPQMGSGNILKYPMSTEYNSFCAELTIVNESHQTVNAPKVETYRDISGTYYNAYDSGYVRKDYKHLMWFGGPGTYKGN